MSRYENEGSPWAAVIIAFLAAALALAGWGCGGKGGGGLRESLLETMLSSVIPGQRQQGTQLVRLQRYPLEDESGSEASTYERFWKIEGNGYEEIDQQEYDRLKEERIVKAQGGWQASEHTIIIRALNEKEGKAAVELGSLHGPLSGEGTVYYMEYREGVWEIMEKATSWVS